MIFEMANYVDAPPISPPGTPASPWSKRVGVITAVTVGLAICLTVLFAIVSSINSSNHLGATTGITPYPIGVRDAVEPSGEAPPGSNSLAGYRLTYETDFKGSTLPSGWFAFKGVPGGDPQGQFALSHVVVHDGVLELNTWQDPQYQDRWVTGGLCQCGAPKTYGAYFVRSRVTGGGANEVELLWPASNVRPPEIDFNETLGSMTESSSTVHFGATNALTQRHVTIDMSQWHTWGVIWTATAITYVVDGQVWATVTTPSEIPDVPMTLNLEQLSACAANRLCPSHPVSMLVNWVAEYSPK